MDSFTFKKTIRTTFQSPRSSVAVLGCAFFLAACSSGEGPTPTATGAVPTYVADEQFTTLSAADDRISGVFEKNGRSLVFDVDRSNGASALRLSTEAGEELYSVVRGDTHVEVRVGSGYTASVPRHDTGAPATPFSASAPNAGIQVTGDWRSALESLKGSELELLPYLTAALGRVGLDGGSTPVARPLHLLALRLTKALGLEFDPMVRDATNDVIRTKAVMKDATATAVPSEAPSEPELRPDALGGNVPAPVTCPGARPPCPAGQVAPASGVLAGCCITPQTPPPPPPDYSKTPSCGSGAAREVFSSLKQDPCRDQCLGMCGPGCGDVWYWVCGDEKVHAACWNHDSAYCPTSFNVWGVSVPNVEYPVCESEYGAYTAEIGADTVLGTLCNNDTIADTETAPWPGLWTIVPTFFVQYKNLPTLLNSPSSGYWSSSVLPGWDSWQHGPAQAGDHHTSSSTMDGNFFDNTVFHSDSGYLGSPPTGAPSGQYWAVDLGSQRNIGAITIYNRTDYWNYPNGLLNNFQILIWQGSSWVKIADDSSVLPMGVNSSPYNQPAGASGSVQIFMPNLGTNSQYVLISKTDDSPLVLADVEVWGY
jgi:hypothetical protein